MKSDVIAVSSREDRTEAVLKEAEKAAAYQELSKRDALHLRLLSEELMSMMRAITGDASGEFWIENRGPHCELHLAVNTPVDFRMRRQLLSASTSGKNETGRGFMGKLRAFFEPLEEVPVCVELGPDGVQSETIWSMQVYQEELRRQLAEEKEGSAEAWDELEKSVIAHLADDVKVSIRGSEVEMTVIREFGKES